MLAEKIAEENSNFNDFRFMLFYGSIISQSEGSFMRTLLTGILLFLVSNACTNAARAETELRNIIVDGSGEVRAEPDRAIVLLGVETRKPDLTAARTDVTHGVDAVLKLARELKIDGKDVRTTRLTVQPEYDWNNAARERRLLGYYVSRQIEITLRNLDQLGLLMERSISVGANNVSEPRLESTRQRDLERQALALAVEDARLNADTAARAAKSKLGSVRSIDSTVSRAPGPIVMPMAARAVTADNDAARNYQAGELTFSASVRMKFDIIAE
jgi:uncharacterized protein YggE